MSSMKRTQRVELSIIYAVLIVAAGITLIPFAYMVCSAFKTKDDFFSSLFLPPGHGLLGVGWDRLTTEHFRRLFVREHFGIYLLNSLFIASVTSVAATLCCAMGGYALAKFRFHGRALVMLLVLGSLVVPGALLLAPSYELLYHLRMLNTYSGVILPAVAPAFGVFLFRQASIGGLPDALLEAARIDGCGEIGIFFGIVLPMVKPMIGAFLMITYLATWNNFIWPQIVLQNDRKFPLAVAIAQLRGVYGLNYGLLMAGSLVSVLPVMVLFLLLQREFIAGLTSGAVKG